MVAGWGRRAPNGLPDGDARFARRDFATEDALTRKLRENKEAIAERQAQLASLKQEVGERDGGPLAPPLGPSAEWRVGVEQPNPFKHSPRTPPGSPPAQRRPEPSGAHRSPSPNIHISEAMRNHPMARLTPTSEHHHPHYHNQRQHHNQTKHHGQQHHQQHHHHQSNGAPQYGTNVGTSRKGSALTVQQQQHERQFLESREQTRRWSAQFNAGNAQPLPSHQRQQQHSRGISI